MLSILIQKPEDLTLSNIFIGYFNAFGELGYKVNWLNNAAIFDRFYEIRPDLVITETGLLDKAMVKACIKYKPVVALYLAKKAQLTEDSITHTKFMLESGVDIRPFSIKTNIWNTGKMSPWHDWLTECNLLPEIVEPAADTIRFKQGKHRLEFVCDEVYIGTWKPEKSHILDYFEWRYQDGCSVRIYGYGNWNHPFHVGAISDKDYMDVIASSSLILNGLGDNQEKIFRAKLANCMYGSICFRPGTDCSTMSGNTGVMDTAEYNNFLENESYIARVKDILKCVNLG